MADHINFKIRDWFQNRSDGSERSELFVDLASRCVRKEAAEKTEEGAPAAEDHSPSQAISAWETFSCALKAATPRVPVTAGIVALNVLIFAAMAHDQGRLLDFNGHTLLQWGADYGPRTFRGQWWRLLTSAFLHTGLAHLSVNLLFLMLAGPLVERLLGPRRFAFVYLFAGLGAGLWTLGWFPAKLSMGASGAVYGVYGCFLGCFLRAPRTIPWQCFRGRSGSWCCSR